LCDDRMALVIVLLSSSPSTAVTKGLLWSWLYNHLVQHARKHAEGYQILVANSDLCSVK